MSKIKTKQLLNEVCNHLKSNYGFQIEYGISDYNNKSAICKLNPNFKDENGNRIKGQFLYLNICEFNVFKNHKKEHFIIWDYRIFQPYEKSKFCVYGGSFGRYEFKDRESFYNHILSDFGPHICDSNKEERETATIPFEIYDA